MGTALHIYDYTYDPYGNLTQRTEDPQGFASVLAYLTNLGISSGEAQAYIKEMMFSATVGPASGAKNNRLNVVTRGGTIDGIATGITPQTSPTMVYDQNGNLTDDGQYVYKYDCLNRQVAVYLPGGSTLKEQYFYDSAGERVAAVESTGATLLTFRQFVRDGAAVLYERKWDRSGDTWVASSNKLYIYAGGRMAATKETVGAGTTYTYYAVDHLGTVRYSRTLNSNGTLITGGAVTYKAEPFGVMIASVTGSPNGNTHFYTGHERDTLPSGFNQDYMHFRYYGSSMGRFFKPDNISDGAAANPQGWNLYTYVKGNPVNFSDPTGHVRDIPEASAHSRAFLPSDPFFSKDFAQPYRMAAVGVKDPNSTNVTLAGDYTTSSVSEPLDAGASLATDMTEGTTTFTVSYPNGTVVEYIVPSGNAVVSDSKAGAQNGYVAYDVSGVSGAQPKTAYGPSGAYLNTGDPRGRDLHGGGTPLGDKKSQEPNQALTPTFGCTRLHNEDALALNGLITQFKRQFNQPVLYVRFGTPPGATHQNFTVPDNAPFIRAMKAGVLQLFSAP